MGSGIKSGMPRELRDIPRGWYVGKTKPWQLLALSGVLALLVGNAAAGLAGGLARSLAFAAAAVLGAVAQVAGFNGFDTIHNNDLP